MKRNTTYYEVSSDFTHDALTDFINQFTFIPHKFGHQRQDPNAVCSDRIISDFELIYIIGGDSYISCGQDEYSCNAGDVVIIPPYTRHKIWTSSTNPHENYWLHFDVFPLYYHSEFLAAMTECNVNRIILGESTELLSLYKLLEHEAATNKPGAFVYFKLVLTQIILVILRKHQNLSLKSSFEKSRNVGETALIDACLQILQDNIFNDIKIETLCDLLHVSESYLFKSFSKVLKMTPNHLIQLMKLKKAEQLMSSTTCTLKEISDMLHFSSQYYFSNVFKKYYNQSPREYINALKSDKVHF